MIVDGRTPLERLDAAARRLATISLERLEVVTRLAETYVAAYDDHFEPDDVFAARVASIGPGKRGAA